MPTSSPFNKPQSYRLMASTDSQTPRQESCILPNIRLKSLRESHMILVGKTYFVSFQLTHQLPLYCSPHSLLMVKQSTSLISCLALLLEATCHLVHNLSLGMVHYVLTRGVHFSLWAHEQSARKSASLHWYWTK